VTLRMTLPDQTRMELSTYVESAFCLRQLHILHCVMFYNTLQQIGDRILYQSLIRKHRVDRGNVLNTDLVYSLPWQLVPTENAWKQVSEPSKVLNKQGVSSSQDNGRAFCVMNILLRATHPT